MDDLDLDRELHARLAVTPSPEFVARVRTKIAEAPPPSLLAGWLKPAAALGCAAVLAIAVGLPREQARLKPSPTEIAQSPAVIAPSPTEETPATAGLKPSTTYIQPTNTSVVVPTFPPSPGSGEVSRKFARSLRTTADRSANPVRSAKPAPEPPLPEVMVAAGDVEALRQFVSGARDLRYVASFDETPASTPWVMTELSIAPIAGDAVDSPPAHNN